MTTHVQHCNRCGGMMVEVYGDLMSPDEIGMDVVGWRCVNCGDYVDESGDATRHCPVSHQIGERAGSNATSGAAVDPTPPRRGMNRRDEPNRALRGTRARAVSRRIVMSHARYILEINTEQGACFTTASATFPMKYSCALHPLRDSVTRRPARSHPASATGSATGDPVSTIPFMFSFPSPA